MGRAGPPAVGRAGPPEGGRAGPPAVGGADPHVVGRVGSPEGGRTALLRMRAGPRRGAPSALCMVLSNSKNVTIF